MQTRVCVAELQKVFDLVVSKVLALVLSMVSRNGLTDEGLTAYRALSSQIQALTEEYGFWFCDVEELLAGGSASDVGAVSGAPLSGPAAAPAALAVHAPPDVSMEAADGEPRAPPQSQCPSRPFMQHLRADGVHMTNAAISSVWQHIARTTLSALEFFGC